MDLQEIILEDLDSTHLAGDMHSSANVNAVMSLRVLQNLANFLTNWAPISVSRKGRSMELVW
jgi:hypothetical protein